MCQRDQKHYIDYTKFSYDYKFQTKRFPFLLAPMQPLPVSFAAVINLSLRNGESENQLHKISVALK